MLPELARRIVTEYSDPGALVVDPLAGIGTTVVEAALLDRRAIGVELEDALGRPGRGEPRPHAGRRASAAGPRSATATPATSPRSSATCTGKVDLIVTSPPYACDAGVIDKPAWLAGGRLCPSDTLNYSTDRANLGHARGDAYAAAMAEIYAACHAVLRPGGRLVVVTKNTRRKGRMLDLAGLTVALATEAGFSYLGHVIALHAAIRDGDLAAATLLLAGHPGPPRPPARRARPPRRPRGRHRVHPHHDPSETAHAH